MLQHLLNYPVMKTGLITSPRGIGTMIAMFFVGGWSAGSNARADHPGRVALTALSLWQMTGSRCKWRMGPVLVSGMLRDLASAAPSCRSIRIAIEPAVQRIMTQGHRDPQRDAHIGGSIGISILEGCSPEHPGRAFAADREFAA